MDEFQVYTKLQSFKILKKLFINVFLKHWDVFLKTTELFILLPILLNLKGNLEMNLAARFSTSVSTKYKNNFL